MLLRLLPAKVLRADCEDMTAKLTVDSDSKLSLDSSNFWLDSTRKLILYSMITDCPRLQIFMSFTVLHHHSGSNIKIQRTVTRKTKAIVNFWCMGIIYRKCQNTLETHTVLPG